MNKNQPKNDKHSKVCEELQYWKLYIPQQLSPHVKMKSS